MKSKQKMKKKTKSLYRIEQIQYTDQVSHDKACVEDI